jgi:hypothetical protein
MIWSLPTSEVHLLSLGFNIFSLCRFVVFLLPGVFTPRVFPPGLAKHEGLARGWIRLAPFVGFATERLVVFITALVR